MSTCIEAPVDVGAHDEAAPAFRPCEFRVAWAASAWQRGEAMALRRAVFCVEQGIFVGDDRDAIDAHAQLLVAQACVGGMPDEVVGTVRIHADGRRRLVGLAAGGARGVPPPRPHRRDA